MESHKLTYSSWEMKDNLLDENLPEVPSTRLDDPSPPAKPPCAANLGALMALPVEIQQKVVLDMDLQTLANFRLVNRRAADVVDALPEYQAILRHAPNVLHGIKAVGLRRFLSLRDVYSRLLTPACETCGCFGGYLYLPACRRVCFLCVSERTEYLPLAPAVAARMFGIDIPTTGSEADANNTTTTTTTTTATNNNNNGGNSSGPPIPCMVPVPGRYSPAAEPYRGSSLLVDRQAALRVGIARHGSRAAMRGFAHAQQRRQQQQQQQHDGGGPEGGEAGQEDGPRARLARARWCGRLGSTCCGPITVPGLEALVDTFETNPARFVGVVRAPWLRGPQDPSPEWGVYCRGCKGRRDYLPEVRTGGIRPFNRLHTPASLQWHVEALRKPGVDVVDVESAMMGFKEW